MKARLRTSTPHIPRHAAAAREPQAPHRDTGQGSSGARPLPAQRLHASQRMVAQRSRLAAAFGVEAGPHATPAHAVGASAPVQRLATSAIKDLQQSGGTCGLYSLGMAMSGVDGSLAGRKAELLRRLLVAGNEVGTFVGEFMDADNLAAVGRKLGFGASVVDFGDAGDMKSKLTATGSAGVVMGYSVFDDTGYQAMFPPELLALTTFKHLFSHWSVIEGLADDKLTVRDPNEPGSTRVVDATAFHQANTDASSASGKFSFGEFERQGVGNVKGLRGTWEGEELGARASGAKAATPLPDKGAPEVELKLKGKIVVVGGSLASEPSTTTDLPSGEKTK